VVTLSSKDVNECSISSNLLFLAFWKDLLLSQKGVVSVSPVELNNTISFIVTFGDPLRAREAISGEGPFFSDVNVQNTDLNSIKITCVPLDETSIKVPERTYGEKL